MLYLGRYWLHLRSSVLSLMPQHNPTFMMLQPCMSHISSRHLLCRHRFSLQKPDVDREGGYWPARTSIYIGQSKEHLTSPLTQQTALLVLFVNPSHQATLAIPSNNGYPIRHHHCGPQRALHCGREHSSTYPWTQAGSGQESLCRPQPGVSPLLGHIHSTAMLTSTASPLCNTRAYSSPLGPP